MSFLRSTKISSRQPAWFPHWTRLTHVRKVEETAGGADTESSCPVEGTRKMAKEGKKKAKADKKQKDTGASAAGAEAASVSVKVLREDSAEASGCVVACFSNAPAPEDLLAGGEPYTFACRQDTKGVRSLSGHKGRIQLEGQQDQATRCYRYLVGVFDPAKGRLEVVDPGGGAAAGNLFSLRRSLRGEVVEGGVVKLSKVEAREALVDGFGSKRVKATHKKRKGTQLEDEGADAMQALEKTLRISKDQSDAARVAAGITLDAKEDGGGPNEHAPAPVPDAEKASQVYTRQALMDDECWDSINPGSVIMMAENQSKDRSSLPAFVIRNLSHVAAAADNKAAKKHTAKLLTLVTYLVRFHLLPSRFKHSPETLKTDLGVPLPLGVHMLRQFAEGADGSYTKPQIQKDKLLLSLAVSCLMTASCDVEIDDLALDLKMHADKVATYFKEVGAKVIKTSKKIKMEEGGSLQASSYRCVLSLPLTFPKRSRGGPGAR